MLDYLAEIANSSRLITSLIRRKDRGRCRKETTPERGHSDFLLKFIEMAVHLIIFTAEKNLNVSDIHQPYP